MAIKWFSELLVILFQLSTSITMSQYNKPSGAKRRTQQKDKKARDKLLLAKVTKLITTMFKLVSSSTMPSTSEHNEQLDQIERETSETMESADLDQKQQLI